MNLLFITSNRLGDAVLSTGLLRAALDRFKPTAVTVACGPIPAPLFRNVPGVARIIPIKKQKWNGHWFQLWRETFGARWDVVIDIRNSAVSSLLGARQVYRLQRPDKAQHKTTQLAAILNLPSVPWSRIWLSESDRRKAAERIPEGTPILALCPTANWGPKTWAAENFVKAARQLPFSRIAVFGAANETMQADPVITALSETHQVINLVGKTDPLEAAACLERAALCLANDSGLMHIAAAVGTPTLGLFGPSFDREYSPWGARTAFLRGAPFHGLENTPDPGALMQAISVDAVVSAAKRLLS